jgi:hypothetical protein
MPASWARAAERSVVNGHAEDVFPFTVTDVESFVAQLASVSSSAVGITDAR